MDAFRLLRKEDVLEWRARAEVYEHVGSGARVLKLAAPDDDNRVFSISFRTPPADSTGLQHICEHSVLCGSAKYRTREPFVDLLRGSLQTFLNAFTFGDKTAYPVASRNPKDFMQLADVYLDAVFNPRVVHDLPQAFLQEGWRYHCEAPDAALKINGVVYSEMRGAYSDPDELLQRVVARALFPASPFRFDSGGDPAVIPTLSYADFCAFHAAYYTPANSYTVLYGDGDTAEELRMLDGYFSRYSRSDSSFSRVPLQPSLPEPAVVSAEYPMASDEDPSEKTIYAISWAIGDASKDAELLLAMQAVDRMLVEKEGAPLRDAVVKAGIARDVSSLLDIDLLQPTWTIIARNAAPGKRDEFVALVLETLKTLLKHGIPRDLVLSSVNRLEFQLREADFQGYPKGIIATLFCLRSWLYNDADPLLHMHWEAPLAAIKAGAEAGGYFEHLLSAHLLESKHRVDIELKPVPGLDDKREAELAAKLAAKKSELGPAGVEKLVSDTAAFAAWQAVETTPQELATIPRLAISDVSPKQEQFTVRETSIAGSRVLHHSPKGGANGVAYLSLHFALDHLCQEDVSAAGLLLKLARKLPTTTGLSHADLATKIDLQTGGVSVYSEVVSHAGSITDFTPYAILRAKVLPSRAPHLASIVGDILRRLSFTADRARVREAIREVRTNMETNFKQDATQTVLTRLRSHLGPKGKFNDALSGIAFYHFLAETDNALGRDPAALEALCTQLSALLPVVFDCSHLLFSVCCSDDDFAPVADSITPILSELKQPPSPVPASQTTQQQQQQQQPAPKKPAPEPICEALVMATPVSWVGFGGNFRRLGFEYNGHLLVALKILEIDKLWRKVRAEGGAYGAWTVPSRDGTLLFCSTRDPHVAETLAEFKSCGEFLAALKLDQDDLVSSVIGTIAEIDQPKTPAQAGEEAVRRRLAGWTTEMYQRERDEVLATHVDDVVALGALFSRMSAADGNAGSVFCAVVGDAALEQNKALFTRTTRLIL